MKKKRKNPPSPNASARRGKKSVKKPERKKLNPSTSLRARKKVAKVFRVKKKVLRPKASVKRKKASVARRRKAAVVKKIVKQWAAAKKTADQSNPIFSPKSFFKAKIRVIGIGGGGGSIVSEIGRSLDKASFVIADTDSRVFKKRPGVKYFIFGQEFTHGLGTGLNTALARQAAEKEKEKIAKFFEGQDIVIFIASLGGGLGSAATQVFAEISKEFQGITMGIFTLPFKFEGANKHKIAAKALRELRELLNVSITIPNERIFKVIDQNTAITDAFSMVNKSLVESLESLIDLIYSPGIINIDFADLKTILSGRGNLAFLNTAEASGKDRAEKISKEILKNPLYQQGNFKVQKVLFNIMGGGNLSMFEVDKISRIIAEQNPKAKIIFGISKDTKLAGRVKTTLLMTGPSTDAPLIVHEAPVEAQPAQKSVKIAKKPAKKAKAGEPKKPEHEPLDIPFDQESLAPSFGGMTMEQSGVKKLNISASAPDQKKTALRRSALEIKKQQEIEERKKSEQEKEWEIPAFLRLKK